MKKLLISILICLACIVSVLFGYYVTKETELGTLSTETVYDMAVEAGYKGTLTEFIDSFRGAVGADGKGIKDAKINSDGHLIITYTDNSVVDAGAVNVGSVTVTEGMSGAAINRALTSSVSIFAKRSDGNNNVGGGVIYKLDKESGTAIILTNNHVLYDNVTGERVAQGSITAYLYGMEYPAFSMNCEFIGGSSTADIAVLRISGSEILKSSTASEISVYDSELISVLDSVVAVGNPGGNGISLVSGNISVESENRYVSIDASGGSIFMRVIRFDASVNKGNSGGGLYDSEGRFIGLVTARDSGSIGVSFAIPSNVVKAVADNILYYCENTDAVNGKLIKLGIGLEVRGATTYYDEASDRTVKVQEIYIKSVEAGSYAEIMGLLTGDKLISVAVDGKVQTVTRVHHAPEMNYQAYVGSTVTYTVLRGNETLTFTVTVPSSVPDLT